MLNNKKFLYLDASATTPAYPRVLSEVFRIDKDYWGNPSSLHEVGIESSEILERSRYSIASSFNVKPNQVIFTSGATESINLALKGYADSRKPGQIVISAVEHKAVVSAAESLTKAGWKVLYWPVDEHGFLITELIDEMLGPNTDIVSIIWGQSEIGTLQPVRLIAEECKRRNIYFHTDASQIISQGIFNFNTLGANAVSISAHKFRGPKGVGILILDDNIIDNLHPTSYGADQEYGKRPGTQPVSLIHGMSIALNNIQAKVSFAGNEVLFDETQTTRNTLLLKKCLTNYKNIKLTGHPIKRLPNHVSILAISEQNIAVSGRKLVKLLSEKGIYTSSGSACSSLGSADSPILKSIGIDPILLASGLRISLGDWLTDFDAKEICYIIALAIESLAKSESK